ncbi:transmembrane protein 100-like [Boleophthalmus pectinirostris]|uniref:transmembrane protein 100-like n=1 Tax=Boleophthalmus pectinirostris TaxID=150288 RepID=UPI00243095DF|nr:transmembrane protein 100-like [Boleophthalmus pectinirostris]
MAHLFLASKISMPDDGKARMPRSASARIPTSCSSDKLANHGKARPVPMATRSAPHSTAEMRLSAATGGSEASCWRCLLPFGAVTLVGGAMLTAVGFWAGPGTHGPTPGPAPPRMGLLGLVLLAVAALMLGTSALCWRLSQRKRKKRNKRRESQAALVQHAHSIA